MLLLLEASFDRILHLENLLMVSYIAEHRIRIPYTIENVTNNNRDSTKRKEKNEDLSSRSIRSFCFCAFPYI